MYLTYHAICLGYLLLAFQSTEVSSQAWLQAPYTNDSFNVAIKYTGNVTLHCEDYRITMGYEVQFWVLPDLTTLKNGTSRSFVTIDGISSWSVKSNGMEIEIMNINERMFGFYHCVVYAAPNHHVIKKAVNYRGAYFGDLWPEYRQGVIIGCSAAGAFLVVAAIAMFIYRYRYGKDDQLPDGTAIIEDVDFSPSVTYSIQPDGPGIISGPAFDSKQKPDAAAGYQNAGFSIDQGGDQNNVYATIQDKPNRNQYDNITEKASQDEGETRL